MYLEEYKYFTNACLNVTDSCNLQCVYCFVEQQPHFMTLETAQKSVDFLIENTRKRSEIEGKNLKANLTFFGGEPTLLWNEVIVPIVDYIEIKYPNQINLDMTTNGTLLNKERILFMYNHKIHPHLSCDGGEFVQNMNRPSRQINQKSFDLIKDNIPLILEYFPNTTMRSTITQQTIEETFNSYLFAVKSGFRSYFTMPNNRENWSKENIYKLNKQLQLIYSFMFTSFIDEKIPISFSSINKAFTWILRHDIQVYNNDFDNFVIERSPYRCGLGITSASFGYDGKIYGCQEQNSYSDGFFEIGNIYSGIDKKKHQNLIESYTKKTSMTCLDKDKCNNCPLRYICQDNCCPSSNYDINRDFFIKPEISCEWEKMLFYNAIPVLNTLVLNNNQTFKNYLDNFCNYSSFLKGGNFNGMLEL